MPSSPRLPRVCFNIAMTADGKITSAAREMPAFTCREDRRRMRTLRTTADAVIVGADTIRSEDPPMHVDGAKDGAWHVVVSGSGKVAPSHRVFTDGNPGRRILATRDNAEVPTSDAYEVWGFPGPAVCPTALLRRLGDAGVESVLVEGGGGLNASFLEAGHLDILHITLCPTLLGGRDAPSPMDGTGLSMAHRLGLQLVDCQRVQDTLFLRYRRSPG